MIPALAVMLAIYCEARLFDQLLNGNGWTTRIVAALAMAGVALSAFVVVAIGEAGFKLPH